DAPALTLLVVPGWSDENDESGCAREHSSTSIAHQGRRALTDRPRRVCDRPPPLGGGSLSCKRKAQGPLLEPLARNVRVDLRGREIAVPEQHLHHTQVRAVIQQVGGEGVPQGLR